MPKRRILIVSHPCVKPLNQQLYAEVQRLTGWEFTILLPAVWKDEFGNSLRPSALPGFSVDLVGAPAWPNGNIIMHTYWFNLQKFLVRAKFDLIYVHHEPYAIATAQCCWANLRAANLPFGFYSAQNISKKYPGPLAWAERMVYRSSNFAFPVTDAVAEVLQRKGFGGALTVCPLAFDPQLYHKLTETERSEIIPRSNGEVVIGYVGRMVEQKGLRTLVESLAQLPSTGWKLVVIGTGPFETTFDELVTRSGINKKVTRLGYVPHDVTPRLLGAMDILVLPSETRANWKEQFGRVLVEAMACGASVIGSDSGEIPNLINASGGGRIFPEGNAAALAKILQEMIDAKDQRNAFANAGCSWAVNNLSLSAVASSMARAMQAALEQPNARSS